MQANMTKIKFLLYFILIYRVTGENVMIGDGKMTEVFSWKQISYHYDGVRYLNDSDYERTADNATFADNLKDSDKFFIQYNNVPIGIEVYERLVFITVPRRRYGIPSTLNYVNLEESPSPLLKPYPDVKTDYDLVSVYRPRVDACARLWMVDTGLLEIPGARRQVKPPAIVVYNLVTKKLEFSHVLESSVIVNERTSGGLTSITVDVDPGSCDDAYAYITDLATEGLIVFSLRQKRSWRINHSSFAHDEASLNFTAAGNVINWKDGLFSLALSTGPGQRTAYYHPLVSTQEFSVDTQVLKSGGANFDKEFKVLGTKGMNTQSGSHVYHGPTKTILYANVAQDAILCWNTDKPLTPENVVVVAQDHEKLVYISDMKIKDDVVWVLVNQIPRFVFSTFNTSENNYFVHSGNVYDLIRGTMCDVD